MSALPGKARSAVTIAGTVAAALLLAACSVADSQRVDLTPPIAAQDLAYAPACNSTLGSYALPKAFVRMRIGQKSGQPPDIHLPKAGDKPIQIVRHADPALVYCLDHLSNVFARDDIKIVKSVDPTEDTVGRKGAFLGSVMVNVTDQTAFIIQALLRSLFIVGSGDADFRDATFDTSEIIADVEFDPFDAPDAAFHNARLTKLGFCVVLDQLIQAIGVNPEQYCRNPLRYGQSQHPVVKAYATKAYVDATAVPGEPRIPGILYRPRHPYKLYVFRKKDPAGGKYWQLQHMTNVEMENLSPILSLGITRAVFAGKNVNFLFDQGTLKTACVSKTSEVEGFVEIPLQISKSLVALPGAIVTVRIDQIKQRQELINAQEKLYLMQEAYLKALAKENPDIPDPPKTKGFPAAADPSKYVVPSDLTRQGDAPGYGQDLLARKLDEVCKGKSS